MLSQHWVYLRYDFTTIIQFDFTNSLFEMVSKLEVFVRNRDFPAASRFIEDRCEQITIEDDDERPKTFIKADLLHITDAKNASNSFRTKTADGRLAKTVVNFLRMALWRYVQIDIYHYIIIHLYSFI